MAMIACAKKAKNKSQEIKLRNKDVQSASSNGKVELSDSSLDEEFQPTEDLQNSFRFKTYIVIIKIYKHKNADQNTGKTRNGDEVVIYIKPEDEILLELSSLPFCFLLHAQQVTTSELKNYILTGLVMVVDANKVGMFRKQLHSLIDES